ncbi:hypothetical protein [Halonotius roseus]|uniref:Uncharacterized protein n=1 Tax=Halonotius roseus TaxID=2511997 RepID=A0A544QR20_9EURY|nr:hypothetical protein [Halonotius roseus]TQQ81893.1 hypothetical protein EWF95_02845 [Halonotius roseus]
MDKRAYIEDALRFWASTWPRNVTKYQRRATSLPEAAELLIDVEGDPDISPFISTYSFPEGHTKNGNIPRVDRLFIDFDVPDTGEYRSGVGREDAWIRDMSALLVRVRTVATVLLGGSNPASWQASLSGHKGIHLDLVFPPISTQNGTFQQFQNGMTTYANLIETYLSRETEIGDLDAYIDVSSADLGRLRRVPNTLHYGATEAFGEDRFCVPVTLGELSRLKPAEYMTLTRSRRSITPGMKPTPNEKAGELLAQQIRVAAKGTGQSSHSHRSSTRDRALIAAYQAAENEKIGVDDIGFILSDRPCVAAFVNRDDAFAHDSASHLMEMKAITEMMRNRVPIAVMVAFFAQANGFNEAYTRGQIEKFIARDYEPVGCAKMWERADEFCLSNCQIRKDAHSDTAK